ncbi:hypothetical protein F3Y22_tig00002655pilonHSYRG00034 [Hibiscus syriacus]|uniref:Uncharacterized protein n=1 Tax=Hibiscus syriacus TaxID=106335 RepID=A0A6A3CRX2_HIBSY|nr:hypothetical protein F3Y22_tig00002655pilonHSYRG00034 [Hibiscus syriacus]
MRGPLRAVLERYPSSDGTTANEGIIRHNRKCRDVAFLVIFIAFWVAMIVNSSFGFNQGNPLRLAPTDDSQEKIRPKTREKVARLMWRACASKRAFRIGVLCAILTPVVKVMAKRLKHTQNDLNEEHVTINSRLCADLPTHGISPPSRYNLTAQHHLSRIPYIIYTLHILVESQNGNFLFW